MPEENRRSIFEQSKKGQFDINAMKKKYRQYVNRQVFKGEDYLSFEDWSKQQGE